MIKLGITGNIASGKSTVERLLNESGIITLDSDKIVHDFLENDKSIIDLIYKIFATLGVDVRDEKGSISRKKVGDIVFSDKTKLKELESIIHPAVKNKIIEFFTEHNSEKIVAVSVPLLFEAGMENLFDFVVLIAVDEEIQLKRLINRNNCAIQEAKARINAQMHQSEKINKADFIIYNNSSLDDLENRIQEFIVKLSIKINNLV